MMDSKKNTAALVLATWFGVGYGPLAPGTWATLSTIPLAWALGKLGTPIYLTVTVVVSLLGIWAANQVVRIKGKEDPQIVVIDEVAGYLLTLLAVDRDGLHLALGFIVFRLLDIAKPGPIGWADRKVPGGLGVMLDDLLAGALGATLLLLLDTTHVTEWIVRTFGG